MKGMHRVVSASIDRYNKEITMRFIRDVLLGLTLDENIRVHGYVPQLQDRLVTLRFSRYVSAHGTEAMDLSVGVDDARFDVFTWDRYYHTIGHITRVCGETRLASMNVVYDDVVRTQVDKEEARKTFVRLLLDMCASMTLPILVDAPNQPETLDHVSPTARVFAEELIARACHPSRFADWVLSHDERAELMTDLAVSVAS